MTVLVTGGAGFIGSAVVRALRAQGRPVLVLDLLTYAGNKSSLKAFEGTAGFHFVQGDICDTALVRALLTKHRVNTILHLAAESHVDRSIEGPESFIQTNLVGTFSMLRAALDHYRAGTVDLAKTFRFHHISTDEVYGDLGPHDPPFTEATPYAPHSPYSASKAGSDFLVQAWHHTYALPTVITNCSNNYGSHQFPEKLIPRTLIRALQGLDILVFGQGSNVRDWLHVDDHARALLQVVDQGHVGQSYAIGGEAERTNNQVVASICRCLDQLRPRSDGKSYQTQVRFVEDRAGHDRRYAIDCHKIRRELGWQPSITFEAGIAETVQWYLDNEDWWAPLWDETR